MFGKIGAAVMLALVSAAQAGMGPTGPATQPDTSVYAKDAEDLGAADFPVRQAATRRLWQAGMVAVPYLQSATDSPNPEAAERAQAVLAYIDEGVVPSTPPAVIHLLEAFRQAPAAEQQNAIIQQLSQAGTDGVRILLRLREKASSIDRVRLDGALAQSPRLAVALLLHEHNRPEAESLLNYRLSEDDSVAYWLVSGQLHNRIEMYRHEDETRLLSRLEWADGDAAAALRDARAGGNVDLERSIQIAKADWPALASEMRSDPPQPTLLYEGGKAMVCRFAGDRAAADAIIAPIADAVAAHRSPNAGGPANDRGAAAALCLNDRPAEAITALITEGMRGEAADLLQAQLRYEQMFALLEGADVTDPEVIHMQAQFAAVADFVGAHARAARLLSEAAEANSRAGDLTIYGALCQSAAQMHRQKDVDTYLLDGLSRQADADAWNFDMANIPTPQDAAWWWRALRDRRDSYAALRTIEAVAGHRASKSESANLATIVDGWSQAQPAEQQPAILHAIVTAMKIAGAPADQIIAIMRAHAETSPSVPILLSLGDALADQHQWPAAADAYAKAIELDPAQPMPVFLHGWAMVRAGDLKAGKAEMELGHLLPLGDMALRLDLFNAARARGLTDDADRERKIMFAVGDPSTVPIADLLGICAADAEKQKDYAAAARWTREELVGQLSVAGPAADQFTYTDLPGQIHRLAAMADLAAKSPDAALAEAVIYYKDLPDDVDGLIGLVRLADAAGAGQQADAIFKLGHDTYLKLCQSYPQSGGLNNQLAWAEARTRRNLPDALSHAQRAVELDPDNTASLDTLAETYYQLHQFQNAIDTIEKCIKLEPSEPHHRKQLARFQLASKTGVADND